MVKPVVKLISSVIFYLTWPHAIRSSLIPLCPFLLFQVSAAAALSATQSSRMSTRLLIDGFIFTPFAYTFVSR